MDLGLEGKIAVVTGASKGIGLAVVRALAAEGARVVAASRSGSPELDALAEGDRVRSVLLDLTEPGAPAALVEGTVAECGGLDVLVNNLGTAVPHPGGFLSVPDEAWLEMFSVNVLTTIRACRAAIPRLLERGGGSIVNVSTVNSVLPVIPMPDYSASKAALKNVSKVLSEEFGAQGIRVNTVSPGPTRTPLWLDPEDGLAAQLGRMRGVPAEEIVRGMEANLALGRYVEPEDVAAAVVVLCSERASTVTGSDWFVDAGRKKTM